MSDHQPPNQSGQGAPRFSRLLATIGSGAVVLSVGLVVAQTINSGAPETLPKALAAPETITSETVSTPTSATSTPATSTTAATSTTISASGYPADASGYVDSAARCAASQTLMAYGRTERALVAICVDPDGTLQYRGVRLSDKAELQLPVTRGTDGTLVAANDGVTYSISPSMLLVSDGDSVIYRDSWLEYEQPSFSSTSTSSTPTTSSPATSANPTTSVSTTTVTVTTSAAPTSRFGN